MPITENQIVNALNIIIARLDNVEKEQETNKKVIVKIKSRLLELNGFVNDVIDIVEDDKYEDDVLVENKLSEFKKANKMIEELEMNINEPISDDLKSMLDQIIGES
jgi:GTP1/Obg family GTP-binding protein|tara:strand:+ start:206 stop:523 length:318 start_codon:yes stop_codon:yes gene_type:complete